MLFRREELKNEDMRQLYDMTVCLGAHVVEIGNRFGEEDYMLVYLNPSVKGTYLALVESSKKQKKVNFEILTTGDEFVEVMLKTK